MTGLLEPLTPDLHDEVLALNLAHQHLTAPMDADYLGYLTQVGTVEVFRAGAAFAGLVVTMTGDSAYVGENFLWFAERYDGFDYLDRVIVHDDFRRQGLAGRVYDEIEARSAARVPVLTLEVNIEPPNEASLAFHAARGFEQVGERDVDDHRVGLLVKRLDPHQSSGSIIA